MTGKMWERKFDLDGVLLALGQAFEMLSDLIELHLSAWVHWVVVGTSEKLFFSSSSNSWAIPFRKLSSLGLVFTCTSSAVILRSWAPLGDSSEAF